MSLEVAQLAAPGGTETPAHLLDDPNYAVEQKLDGHRVMMIVEDGKVSVQNRNGEPKENFPSQLRTIIESAPAIQSGRWVFDGELIKNTYWVFDLLEMPQGRVSGQPWMKRRLLLDKLFALLAKAGFSPDEFQTTIWEVEDKWSLYNRCLAEHKEGVIFKRIDTGYRKGRHDSWVKHKFQKSCEVVVTELDRKGKEESISIGLYDEHGVLHNAGGCRLLPKFAGKVNVGDVVEMRYLYSMAESKKLYQPHMMHIRTDKQPHECTQDQLIFTDKEVIRA
jgi:ATP-dependent DNA ligase